VAAALFPRPARLAVAGSRAHGKLGEQPAGGGRERELLAIAFCGRTPQQPHLEHALTVHLRPGSRLRPLLTLH
jgi:hypothetical protein